MTDTTKLNTRFEPIPLYSTPCNNCGKLIKDHFDGYCERQKPEVTSPLSDDEIDSIWWSLKPVGNEMPSHHDIGRAIAIAAKIATIRQVAAMPSETTLTDSDLSRLYFHSVNMRRAVANGAMSEFQRTLLAGIGETE